MNALCWPQAAAAAHAQAKQLILALVPTRTAQDSSLTLHNHVTAASHSSHAQQWQGHSLQQRPAQCSMA
jgi:hypothetical protein